MSSETIPEWARLEGERRAMELVPAMALTFDHSHGLKDYDQRKAAELLPFRQIAQHEVGPAIARALLAAEQRGLEKAAAKADDVANNPPGEWFVRVGEDKAYSCGAIDCAFAIRSLGDKT